MEHLASKRIELIPLNITQLINYLEQPSQLELELGILVSRTIISDRVRRAINMKIIKMENLKEIKQYWSTYWLIVIRNSHFGAGLIGFKGYPNQNGEVEIGYGIDPDYQSQGFMTEALRMMMKWAFEEKACNSIVALGVQKTNIPSQRVLEKVGMKIMEKTNETLSYKINREEIIENN
jgi:ribosomal protein S18 acetylase RimI-like enzyme